MQCSQSYTFTSFKKRNYNPPHQIAPSTTARSLDDRHVRNSVYRRVKSLARRSSGALVPVLAAAVARVEGGGGQIRVSQIVLALDLVTDMLLDAQVERLVIRVRLDAEGEAAWDVADVRARVPVRWLGWLCGGIPRRPLADDAPAVLGVGQDVEADRACDRGGGVRRISCTLGGVPDWPVGWRWHRSWWTLVRERGRRWTILLDVVHRRVPLFALWNSV